MRHGHERKHDTGVREARHRGRHGRRDGKVRTGAQTETRVLISTVGQVLIQTDEVQEEGSNKITLATQLD